MESKLDSAYRAYLRVLDDRTLVNLFLELVNFSVYTIGELPTTTVSDMFDYDFNTVADSDLISAYRELLDTPTIEMVESTMIIVIMLFKKMGMDYNRFVKLVHEITVDNALS